jgi:hypothetical protein
MNRLPSCTAQDAPAVVSGLLIESLNYLVQASDVAAETELPCLSTLNSIMRQLQEILLSAEMQILSPPAPEVSGNGDY